MTLRMSEISIRPYGAADEVAVLELLTASLGGGPAGRRPPEFFRWKHIENPFGRSLMLVAEADGRMVGLRAFMRWRWLAGDRVVRAVRAVDTATHPAYQGRGIFSKLTLQALDLLRGDVDIVFNTPNEKSLPGYLKMGWRTVGKVPIRVRVQRPIRFARRMRSLRDASEETRSAIAVVGEAAGAVLEDASAVEKLLAARGRDERLTTDRSTDFLRWRYERAPLLGYRAVRETTGDVLRGFAFFRVRPRGRLVEATVADLVVDRGDREGAKHLLRKVARAARVDHLTCSFPAGTVAAAASVRAGYLRAPGGLTLVVNALTDDLPLDPTDLRSWAPSLGDLEVF